jgi:hypothetical protein
VVDVLRIASDRHGPLSSTAGRDGSARQSAEHGRVSQRDDVEAVWRPNEVREDGGHDRSTTRRATPLPA